MTDINSIIEMIENLDPDIYAFRDACDDIIEQLRKMSDWQDISMAPKDGAYVDLLINNERAVNCKFLDGEWVDWDCREGKFCWSGEPSHWMRIPLPPNSKEL